MCFPSQNPFFSELTAREQLREVGFWSWTKDCCQVAQQLPGISCISSSFRTTHRHIHTHTQFSFSKDCLAVIWIESHLSPTAVPCYSLLILCNILYWMHLYKFLTTMQSLKLPPKAAIQPSSTQLSPPTFLYASSSCDHAVNLSSELIWLRNSLKWGQGRHTSAESRSQSGLLHGQTVLWAEWWGRTRMGAGNWEESSISFSSSATLRCLH